MKVDYGHGSRFLIALLVAGDDLDDVRSLFEGNGNRELAVLTYNDYLYVVVYRYTDHGTRDGLACDAYVAGADLGTIRGLGYYQKQGCWRGGRW